MKVEDLDVLRPEPSYVRMGGKDIDVYFIPCGITFEIDALVQQLQPLVPEINKGNIDAVRKGFELSVKMCAVFCAYKYPEMDEKWFKDNTDIRQIQLFAQAIRGALEKAYNTGSASGGGDPKN